MLYLDEQQLHYQINHDILAVISSSDQVHEALIGTLDIDSRHDPSTAPKADIDLLNVECTKANTRR